MLICAQADEDHPVEAEWSVNEPPIVATSYPEVNARCGPMGAETLDPRWTPLVKDALASSRDRPPDLHETLAYIRYTGERGKQTETLDG